MGKVKWIIFAAVIILLLGGLIVYSRLNSEKTADIGNVNANSVIAANDNNGQIGDHVFNNTESPIVLVEYGDFQCPGCKAANPNVMALLDTYGDKISFVFRNFPLTSIHPNARAAAAAAEAAGLQGKYWEMHDYLYVEQDAWGNLDARQRTDTFKRYAASLGLDVAQFETDLASANVNKKISFDQTLGTNAGVNSTPTFMLNGEMLPEGAANGLLQGDLTEIKKLLDEKLAE